MWLAARRLSLGMLLIIIISGILLRSDRQNREGYRAKSTEMPRVATFPLASRPIMDELVRGGIEGLRAAGFVDGENIRVERYNAEGDIPTANSIAQELVARRYDLILTYSTPTMQAMATANRSGTVTHVFAGVADPFMTGVPGLNRDDLADHPDHLVGIGTAIPVRAGIELAYKLNPTTFKTLGIVWNPAEANSEICTMIAREVCAELGITLVEAQVDNSASVLEAAQSLTARGADAIYLGGDNTVDVAFNSLQRAAEQARIPLFTYSMIHGEAGALFGLGADYFQVGVNSGRMAADILNGTAVNSIPIELEVPVQYSVNLSTLKNLKDSNWRVPSDVLDGAAFLFDADGKQMNAGREQQN